uniref:Nuclear receptor domain-containing protein n=1 Tax=Heterorhabditis bacteriophora TaxID=37862 RepID=A0A1I7XIP2_HETBA
MPSYMHKIHAFLELRMICRHCRYVNCIRAGMKKELVQARREDRSSPKEARSRKESLETNSSGSESYPPGYGNGDESVIRRVPCEQ